MNMPMGWEPARRVPSGCGLRSASAPVVMRAFSACTSSSRSTPPRRPPLLGCRPTRHAVVARSGFGPQLRNPAAQTLRASSARNLHMHTDRRTHTREQTDKHTGTNGHRQTNTERRTGEEETRTTHAARRRVSWHATRGDSGVGLSHLNCTTLFQPKLY